MTTHERELTQPVDLCTPDGGHVNAEALGWSRQPLHRANLDGHLGDNKRWDYWAILAGDFVVSSTIADLDHFAIADVYWADFRSGQSGGSSILVGPEAGIGLPERPGTVPLHAHHQDFKLDIVDDVTGTTIEATWYEPDGQVGHLSVLIRLPANHESLNVVIPWDDDHFTFTSKHQARRAVGHLSVGDLYWPIGGPGASEAWGVLDVGRGRWPSRITWNWGGGAGHSGGHVVGLQFGAKWTEGSGFTENGFIVDGRLHKLGRELTWEYDWDSPMKPWRIHDPGGQLDAVLSPRFDKHTHVEVSDDLGSEVHQVFGTWSGRLRTDDGVEIDFTEIQGFAEEARQRW